MFDVHFFHSFFFDLTGRFFWPGALNPEHRTPEPLNPEPFKPQQRELLFGVLLDITMEYE
jgi:hypothetical protein